MHLWATKYRDFINLIITNKFKWVLILYTQRLLFFLSWSKSSDWIMKGPCYKFFEPWLSKIYLMSFDPWCHVTNRELGKFTTCYPQIDPSDFTFHFRKKIKIINFRNIRLSLCPGFLGKFDCCMDPKTNIVGF